ncbi:MAG: asparagine--tRNA ligase [Nanoarchaeota archaeon]
MTLSIQEAMDKGTGEVEIHGWVYRERGSNKLRFLVIRDYSNIIQCVIEKDKVDEQTWKDATEKASIEAAVQVKGNIKPDQRAPGGYEITVKTLEIVGESHTYPITKDQSPEFLLDMRHLWVRSRKLNAVFKIRHTLFQAFREYFNTQGFFESHMPMFTPTACEGGSTLFPVKFFNDTVYLAQSWQLYAESVVSSLEKIYTISPCFRAEKSRTSRHLAEFWMAEMEQAWADLDIVIGHAEACVSYMVQQVVEKNERELLVLEQDIEKLKKIKTPFPRITYTEALELLKKKEGMKIEWGKDLRTVEEDLLTKHFDRPVIVTHYPREIMAFYKQPDPENKKVALCFDMLAPEGFGEIIGGSQRDTDIHRLIEALNRQGEPLKNYEWYLDLRRFGSVPHAGWGLGMERVIAWVCKLDNIKDTIPFPRTMLRKSP